VAHSYEGVVAKDNGSKYVAGRTLHWLKVKQRDYRTAERGWLIRDWNPDDGEGRPAVDKACNLVGRRQAR
jgi:ATP-dependent DNA ligase